MDDAQRGLHVFRFFSLRPSELHPPNSRREHFVIHVLKSTKLKANTTNIFIYLFGGGGGKDRTEYTADCTTFTVGSSAANVKLLVEQPVQSLTFAVWLALTGAFAGWETNESVRGR